MTYKNILSIGSLLLVGVLAFFNTLDSQFVYDDHAYIENNPHIQSLRHIPDYFTNLFAAQGTGPEGQFKVYRPLVAFSFAIDHAVWGLNPHGFHLTNLVLHISVGILIFIFIHILTGQRLTALITGTVFLVHPLQTEAVSWLSGRGNMLYCLFGIITLIFSVRFIRTNRLHGYFLSLLFFIPALFSKEMAMNLIPLTILIIIYDRRVFQKKSILLLISMSIIALLYMSIRYSVVERIGQMGYWGNSRLITMLTMSKVILIYLCKLFFPFNQSVLPDITLINSVFSIQAIVSVLILITLTITLCIYRNQRLAVFGLLWIILTLMPVLNIIPIRALYAERFLYFGIVGFGLFICHVATVTIKNKKRLSILFGIISLIYCSLTIKQNKHWSSDYTLWQYEVNRNLHSGKAYNGLGLALLEKGYADAGLSALSTAVALEPDNSYYINNLAVAYQKTGDIEALRALLRNAPLTSQSQAVVYHNLGVYHIDKGQPEKALPYLLQSTSIDSNYANAFNTLGICYAQLNENSKALLSWQSAITIYPTWKEPYYNIIINCINLKDTETALLYIEKAQKIFPKSTVFENIKKSLE
ncbi:MAG: hypothetical protein AB1454_08570 [Candidatus Auribacterota bacterium]